MVRMIRYVTFEKPQKISLLFQLVDKGDIASKERNYPPWEKENTVKL